MKHLILPLLLATQLLAEKKPNIVFFLVDDLGIQDLSGEGSSFYETPRIDELASQSARFSNGYSTCQVCSPSRASILTGKYPPRIGITDWIGAATGTKWTRNDKILPAPNANKLALEEFTLAEALAEGGYATWFLGKWHLGGQGSHPEDHGFQVNIGGHHRGGPLGGYFAPFLNPKIKQDPPAGTLLPLWLADQTSELISEHQSTDPEKPFLAYLSFYSVHGPIQTTPELWKKYQQKSAKNPHQGDRFLNDRTLPVRQVQDCPIYAGMMEALDQAVGKVLDTLTDLKLENDTIIVFTGDNGGVTSGDAFATAALPLRGGKGRQWEGGLRAPFYLKVPALLKKEVTIDTPVTGTDFYPTLLDLAGLPARSAQHVDGLSLKPLLEGGELSERVLFWHYPHYGNQGGEPTSILRDGEWKLIQYLEDQRVELYHLPSDIGEQKNLAAKNPERVQALLTKLKEQQKETGAILPEPDPRYDAERKKQQLQKVQTVRKNQLEKQHANFLDPDYKPNQTWWGSVPLD